MNPRMDEVSKAVRAVFPMIDGKHPRYGHGWLLALSMSAAGSVVVALKNPARGHLTFSVRDTDNPAAKVASAADRFSKRTARQVPA